MFLKFGEGGGGVWILKYILKYKYIGNEYIKIFK